jgi:hypothetical protein
MQDQNDAFNERQLAGQEGVEKLAKRDKCNDYECEMPPLWYVVGVVEYDETLNLLRAEESDGRVTNLPTKYTEPAYNVGEELLT